jgi:putative heme-binding domain-containing protein
VPHFLSPAAAVSVLFLAALPAFGQRDLNTPEAYRDYAYRQDGNVARGRELFLAAKAGCAQCHSIDGTSSKAGPDLMAVGDVLGRRELIEAILEPSATIAIGYDATILETRAGESFFGIIKQSTAGTVALMGADGQLVHVPTLNITARRGSPVSMMATGLHTALTRPEFVDLIEFLASLRQPANLLSSAQGMPEPIAKLDRMVTLRPFLREELRFPYSTVQKPGDIRAGLVWFGQVPGSPGAYLGVHQSGRIWRIEKAATGDTKTLFADFSAEVFAERGPNGLVGLAFHPRFRENRKYYLKHQVLEAGEIVTTLVEKRAAADFKSDSGEPSRRLLAIPTVTQNHTGGCIEFGPDGYLYLGMGDTGPQQDPNGHGQDMGLLLGKMIRIDVDRRDGDLPYAIPADNPFRGRAGVRPEIWAYGFREPWRFSFDPATGDLWVGDVGQNRVEEVTIVRRGENHGWNVYEAFESFSNLRRRAGESYVPPVFAYRRLYGNSITGGYVYRGNPRSSFQGVYICGDYTSHLIWGLTEKDRTLQTIRHIATSPEGIVTFATDEEGRMFVVGYEGMVYEMDFSTAEFPRGK